MATSPSQQKVLDVLEDRYFGLQSVALTHSPGTLQVWFSDLEGFKYSLIITKRGGVQFSMVLLAQDKAERVTLAEAVCGVLGKPYRVSVAAWNL